MVQPDGPEESRSPIHFCHNWIPKTVHPLFSMLSRGSMAGSSFVDHERRNRQSQIFPHSVAHGRNSVPKIAGTEHGAEKLIPASRSKYHLCDQSHELHNIYISVYDDSLLLRSLYWAIDWPVITFLGLLGFVLCIIYV
jgi:hypothetical protein